MAAADISVTINRRIELFTVSSLFLHLAPLAFTSSMFLLWEVVKSAWRLLCISGQIAYWRAVFIFLLAIEWLSKYFELVLGRALSVLPNASSGPSCNDSSPMERRAPQYQIVEASKPRIKMVHGQLSSSRSNTSVQQVCGLYLSPSWESVAN